MHWTYTWKRFKETWKSFLGISNSFSTYFQWLIGRCSLVFGASIMQDRDLNEYTPSGSSTSKYLYCSHQLCESGPKCKSRNQSCPYTINYYTENVSSSGLLVEDILHLVSRKADGSNNYVRSPVIIGWVLLSTYSIIFFIRFEWILGDLYQ